MREYNSHGEALVSEEELNGGKKRYKHLKTLEWILYGVGVVAVTVMCAAMWNPGEYLSRSARHSLMVFSWLAWTGFGLWRLILMRKRTAMSEVTSPTAVTTLGLSESGMTNEEDGSRGSR